MELKATNAKKHTRQMGFFQATHLQKRAHKKQKDQLPGTGTNRITLHALIVSQTHSSGTPQSIQDSAGLRVTFHRPTAKLHYLLNCHFTRTHAAFVVAPVTGGHIKAINNTAQQVCSLALGYLLAPIMLHFRPS